MRTYAGKGNIQGMRGKSLEESWDLGQPSEEQQPHWLGTILELM